MDATYTIIAAAHADGQLNASATISRWLSLSGRPFFICASCSQHYESIATADRKQRAQTVGCVGFMLPTAQVE
jgi:hypothetical protein